MPGDTTVHRSRSGDLTANTLIERLIAAWEAGSPVPLGELLPPEPAASMIADVACQEIELKLRAGQPVRVADYLAAFPQVAALNDLVVYLLEAEVLGRKKHGPPPALDEYIREFPHLRAELERLFGVSRSALPSSPEGYDLLEEIGRGGMGVIYRARDKALKREVAIKVLQDRFAPDSSVGKRFLEEAQITGQLQHPGIPAIHQVGTLADGRPFLAMKLIKGQTLATLIKDKSEINTLGVFESICQAVGYAHERGVIHRDLKPENVMVGAFGEVQVMDWGLAKFIGAKPTNPTAETQAEAPSTAIEDPRTPERFEQTGVAGTPWYMAPEQAAGEQDKIDTRTDVFALGGILCAILTGKPPIEGADAKAAFRNAVHGDTAAAIKQLDASGVEFGAIELCKSCLAFAASERPANAATLANAIAVLRAEAFERTKRAELESARFEERTAAERRRRKLQSVAGLIVITALAIGGGLAVSQAIRATRAEAETSGQLDKTKAAEAATSKQLQLTESARKDADQQAARAIRELERSERQLYASRVNYAHVMIEDGNYSAAYDALAECPQYLRGWEYDLAWTRLHGNQELRAPLEPFGSIEWSPDGKRIATTSGDGTIRLWDSESGVTVLEMRGHDRGMTGVSWSPNGSWIVSVGMDGKARVWDVASGTLHAEWKTRAKGVAWSPDGVHLLTWGGDQFVRVWDAETAISKKIGREVRAFSSGQLFAQNAVFAPDGKSVFVNVHWRTVAWEVPTGKLLGEINHGYQPQGLAVTPDGKRVLVGVGPTKVFDWAEKTARVTLMSRSPVTHIVVSPDGDTVATGDAMCVSLWSLMTGAKLRCLPKGSGYLAFSRDGRRLAALDGIYVRVWDVDRGTGPETLSRSLGPMAGVFHTCFGPNEAVWFVTHSPDRTAAILDARTRQHIATLPAFDSPVNEAAVSRTSGLVVCASIRGQMRIVNPATGQVVGPVGGHRGATTAVEWNPAGNRFAVSASDGTTTIWDALGKKIFELPVEAGKVQSLAWSPDGTKLLTGRQVGGAQLWDATTGRLLRSWDGDGGPAKFVAYSPDARRIIIGGTTTRIFDPNSESPLHAFVDTRTQQVSGTFSSNSSRVVTGGIDGLIGVYDVESGIRLTSLKANEPFPVRRVEFDGPVLLAHGDFLGGTKLWSGKRRQDRFQCNLPSDSFATQVAFNLTGTRVFAMNEAKKQLVRGPVSPKLEEVLIPRRVHVWDTSSGHPVPPVDSPAMIAPYSTISPNGRYRVFNQGWRVLLIDTIAEAANSMHWPRPGREERIAYHSMKALFTEAELNWCSAKFHAETVLLEDSNNQEMQRCRDAAIRQLNSIKLPDK